MLDLFILLALAIGLVIGLRSGLIKQAASFIGFLLAILAAVRLMEPVGATAVESLGISESIGPLVGFVLVFLLVQAVVLIVVKLAETVIGVLKLTFVNRALGGLLGVGKAALVLSVLFLVGSYLGVPGSSAKDQSALYEPVARVLPQAWDFVAQRLPQLPSLSERFDPPVDAASGDASRDPLAAVG